MPVQTIEDPSPSRPRGKLAHGQCVNVAGAPMIEITRTRVMARMVASPVIVRSEGNNADGSADPIVRKTAVEERPVAAVMLDHKETNEQPRRRHFQQQTNPMAAHNNNQHQSPDDRK